MNATQMLDSLERRVARLTRTRDEWSPEARKAAAEARKRRGSFTNSHQGVLQNHGWREKPEGSGNYHPPTPAGGNRSEESEQIISSKQGWVHQKGGKTVGQGNSHHELKKHLQGDARATVDALERRVARLTRTRDEWSPEARKAAAEARKNGSSMSEREKREASVKESARTGPAREEARKQALSNWPPKKKEKYSGSWGVKDARATIDALEKRVTLLTLARRLQKAQDAADFIPLRGTRDATLLPVTKVTSTPHVGVHDRKKKNEDEWSPEARKAAAEARNRRTQSPSKAKTGYDPEAVNKSIQSSNRSGKKIGGKEARAIHSVLKGWRG